jgi:ABC-2 type transport system ATP-binding protein
MYRGKVIALGAPAELRANLGMHTLLQLNTSAPLETMRALEHVPGVGDVAVFGGGLHVAVDELDSGTEAIRSRLAAAGIEIHRLEKILPSLEDVFVALIEAEEKKIA